MPVWRMQLRSLAALGRAAGVRLTARACSTDYDLIFLDTPPALGYLTINALLGRRYPAGAPRRVLPGVRLARGGSSTCSIPPSPRIEDGENAVAAARRAARDALRMGCRAGHDHPLRCRPADRSGERDPGLFRRLHDDLPAGFHRHGRAGGRAGERHLRGRLPRVQPRYLRPRARDVRPDLGRGEGTDLGELVARRADGDG